MDLSAGRRCGAGLSRRARRRSGDARACWEYLDDDVNKYWEVLRHPCGVQTLQEVTRGKPERSRIYREYMAVEGIAQEMLVALGTRKGEFWGTVRLNRLPGQPDSTQTSWRSWQPSHLTLPKASGGGLRSVKRGTQIAQMLRG